MAYQNNQSSQPVSTNNLDPIVSSGQVRDLFDRFAAHTRYALTLDDQFTFPHAPAAGDPTMGSIFGLVTNSGLFEALEPEQEAVDNLVWSGTKIYPKKFPVRETAEGLVAIGNGHRLLPEAAAYYLSMRNQALRAGIRWTVSQSYRTMSEQIERYKESGGRLEDGKWVGGSGYAARPGRSNHQAGVALDIAELTRRRAGTGAWTHPIYNWLFDNGYKWGWVNPQQLRDGTGVNEAWHWEWHPECIGIVQRRLR